MKKNYIILDTETGGIDPKTSSLLQVGIVFVKDNEVVDKRLWNIRNEIYKVSPSAMKVNNLDLSVLYNTGVDIETFFTGLNIIVHRIYNDDDKPIVIGHNVAFDLSYINHYLGKERWETLFSYRTIDTATIGKFLNDCGVISIDKNDLDTLSIFFNVQEPLGDRHTALYDALITWELYKKMVNYIRGNIGV